jgi:hypothetical protein
VIKFLRTASIRRLLATVGAVVGVIAAGTAIAVAASSGGPVPKPASLADAVEQGLAAPQISGISANITFTNHLIDASNLQGSDPLLQGGSGRVWFSPASHQLRLELQSDNGDAEALVSHGSFWLSDPSSNTVYEGTLPTDAGSHTMSADHVPSLADVTDALGKLAHHLDFNGAAAAPFAAAPGDVGGQPTYSVRVSSKHDGGLLGAVRLAWDATHGIPLDVSIYASGDPSPVIELQASNISYGPVDSGVFAITPPTGDTVVKISGATGASNAADGSGAHGANHVSALAAVAASVPFALKAPATAAGLPRQDVRKLDWGGKPGALITYGQGIGGIAVLERPADASAGHPSSQGGSGLSVPTISIDGISAHELDTALGTGIMFTSAGVSYTVLGSVPPTAAEAAATDIAKAP